MIVAPLRSVGPGRILVFVGGIESLVDLDQRLQLRVVVAPVGALVRRAAVRRSQTAELPQIRVEDRPRVHLACLLVPRNGKLAIAALREERVAMAVGIRQTSLGS